MSFPGRAVPTPRSPLLTRFLRSSMQPEGSAECPSRPGQSGQKGNPELALEHRAFLSSLPFLDVSPVEMEAVRDRLMKCSSKRVVDDRPVSARTFFTGHDGLHSEIHEYLIGLLSARLGDEAATLEHASRLGNHTLKPPMALAIQDLVIGLEARVAGMREAIRRGAKLSALRDARYSLDYLLTPSSPILTFGNDRYYRATLLNLWGCGKKPNAGTRRVTKTAFTGKCTLHLLISGEVGFSSSLAENDSRKNNT